MYGMPAEIDVTAQVIYDASHGPAALADACSELADAGCGLAVVYLPETEHRPEVLDPIASALAPLS